MGRLQTGLEAFFANEDCAKYLNALIAALPKRQGSTERFEGDLMGHFTRVKNGGGFGIESHVRASASFSAIRTRPHTIPITILINPEPFRERDANLASHKQLSLTT